MWGAGTRIGNHSLTLSHQPRSEKSDLYKGHIFRDVARGSNAILEPRAIAKAPEGEGCPRCGGYVYAAEQMLARGRVSFSENSSPPFTLETLCYTLVPRLVEIPSCSPKGLRFKIF